MALKVARRGGVPPFIVMDVMRAANEAEAAGRSIIHMEVGQPGTPAPAGVRDAATRAIQAERLGYTEARGIPELRQRIVEHYRAVHGVTIDPASVMVTAGSSAGFVLSFLAAFEPGDRIALAAPGYPAYRNILRALDLEPVELETHAEDRFQPTVAALEELDGAVDGLLVASPSNPTGTMVSRSALAELAEWCHAAGVRLISDEIYHGITFGAEETTAADVDTNAIVINSFSKYFSMTGWRIGWMLVPQDLRRPVECLAQNIYISAPAVSQYAAAAAFDCRDELDGHVERYRRNRDLLIDALPKAGFDKLAPADGAFYLYADIGHMTGDSAGFCKRMLEEAGVAATPGTDFDPMRGHRFMRFSFAGTTEDMEEAARRLVAWRA